MQWRRSVLVADSDGLTRRTIERAKRKPLRRTFTPKLNTELKLISRYRFAQNQVSVLAEKCRGCFAIEIPFDFIFGSRFAADDAESSFAVSRREEVIEIIETIACLSLPRDDSNFWRLWHESRRTNVNKWRAFSEEAFIYA